MVTSGRRMKKVQTLSPVAAKERLAEATRLFLSGDAKGLAALAYDAYSRLGISRLSSHWIIYEEGRVRACPLAVIIMDCFPRLGWGEMGDDDATASAKTLCEECFGARAVHGFERGLDGMTREFEMTPEYDHGRELGMQVWCQLNCMSCEARANGLGSARRPTSRQARGRNGGRRKATNRTASRRR